MKVSTIRFRLTVWYAALVTGTVLVLGIAVYSAAAWGVRKAADAELTSGLNGIEAFLHHKLAIHEMNNLGEELREHSALMPRGKMFRVRDGNGVLVYQPDVMAPVDDLQPYATGLHKGSQVSDGHVYRTISRVAKIGPYEFSLQAAVDQTEYRNLINRLALLQHLLLGEFMSKIGGQYITHMIAPSSILNEVADDEAYSRIDLKTWIKNLNEVARNVFEQWGVKLAYHPEQREVSHHLYEQVLKYSDERFVHFIADVGHLAAGGADPVGTCKKYRKRLVAVHLKDFSPTPPNGTAVKAGNVAFGKGNVDLAGIVAELNQSSFTGWVMGESGAGDEAMYRYMREDLGLTF